VPSGHDVSTYNGIMSIQPSDAWQGPFYMVTRGRLIGIFACWFNAGPQVMGVCRSNCQKVDSVEMGRRLMLDAIDDHLVMYL
ncbi:hypothetical protein PAXRUDRAFT_181250, partial [Paxillus rubicundulus Ve08.2h10]